MVDYARNTSKWEAWQRDYRLGLILIMPPKDISRQFDSLRAKHDPRSHAICPTHVSLSDPLQRELTHDRKEEIQSILSQITPFTLHYGKPQASTEHPGVACPVTPQERIDNLKQALHAASLFTGKVYQRRHIPAHITIAEFISIEDSLTLCAQLQDTVWSGSFLCDRLQFIVPDENFHFQRKATFFLGNPRQHGESQ